MYHRPDYGFEIQDIFCGRIMVMMKLKLEKINSVYDESGAKNETSPYVYVKPGTKVLKELFRALVGKIRYSGSSRFKSFFCEIYRIMIGDGPCLHWCRQ